MSLTPELTHPSNGTSFLGMKIGLNGYALKAKHENVDLNTTGISGKGSSIVFVGQNSGNITDADQDYVLAIIMPKPANTPSSMKVALEEFGKNTQEQIVDSSTNYERVVNVDGHEIYTIQYRGQYVTYPKSGPSSSRPATTSLALHELPNNKLLYTLETNKMMSSGYDSGSNPVVLAGEILDQMNVK